MIINFTTPKEEKRKIKTCKAGEAFRWGEDWYIYVSINDKVISYFGEFYDEHVLTNMPKPTTYNQAVPVLHVRSQSFCYANGEIEADEWANVTADLAVK